MNYDGENRLTAYNSANVAGYTYDGNGLRVIKSVSGGTATVSVFSGSSLIAEYDNGAAPTTPTREYVYGGLGLLAMLSGGTTTYYHQDHLSVRLTTDANGNVLTQQATFPFGEQWYQSGSGNKFVFTSYDRDSESGLDYAMARYYYSSTGTFIMADPVAGTPSDPQSWNRYPYGRNNPINITDPSGKSWWEKLLVGIGVAVASTLFTPVIDGWWAGVLAGEGAASAAGNTSPHAVGNSTPGDTNSPGLLAGAFGSSDFSGDSTSSSVYSSTGSLSYNAGNPYSSTSSTPMFTVTLLYNTGGTNSAQKSMDMLSAAPSNSGLTWKQIKCGSLAGLPVAVDAASLILDFAGPEGTAAKLAIGFGLSLASTAISAATAGPESGPGDAGSALWGAASFVRAPLELGAKSSGFMTSAKSRRAMKNALQGREEVVADEQTSDRSDKLSALIALLACVPVYFLVAHFRNSGEARAAAVCFGVFIVVLQTFWSLRRELWYWITLSLVFSGQVFLISRISWSSKDVTSPILGFIAMLDFFMIYGTISLAKQLMTKSTGENS
jgi:RHS repeat-associated protein